MSTPGSDDNQGKGGGEEFKQNTGVRSLFSGGKNKIKKRQQADRLTRVRTDLTRLHGELYSEICKGMTTNLSMQKLGNMDMIYIARISDRLDNYIDKLVTSFNIHDIIASDIDSDIQSKIDGDRDLLDYSKTHCRKEKKEKCEELPGTALKKRKTFIPQVYHVLGDFGFFAHYLDFTELVNPIDRYSRYGEKTDKYDEWKARWLPSLYRKIDEYSREDKLAYLKKICLRIRRVQFMRSFEFVVCVDSIDHSLKKNIDYDSDDGYGSHDKILEFLDIVFNALQDDIRKRNERMGIETDQT